MVGVSLDPEQARKILRIYRGAMMAGRGMRGYRKAKSMLDDHAGQTDLLMDAEGLVTRVREKRVEPRDVHNVARAAVNSVPRIYRFVALHVQKNRESGDA